MKFIKLIPNEQVNLQEFVQFWSSCYYDPREDLYIKNINKEELSESDLLMLFEWKNGGHLSKIKKKALATITNKKDVINKLKSNFDLEIFKKEFNFITGIIWKIYLLHLIAPDKYPIFDQHVYRALFFLTQRKIQEVPKRSTDKERFYFNEYIIFFNELVKNDIPRKKVDEALWTFGKFLKTPYRNIIEAFPEVLG